MESKMIYENGNVTGPVLTIRFISQTIDLVLFQEEATDVWNAFLSGDIP
jgi:hypothetical protein